MRALNSDSPVSLNTKVNSKDILECRELRLSSKDSVAAVGVDHGRGSWEPVAMVRVWNAPSGFDPISRSGTACGVSFEWFPGVSSSQGRLHRQEFSNGRARTACSIKLNEVFHPFDMEFNGQVPGPGIIPLFDLRFAMEYADRASRYVAEWLPIAGYFGAAHQPVGAAFLEARQGTDPAFLSIEKTRRGDLPRPAKDTTKG
jgi:hypothetical protein